MALTSATIAHLKEKLVVEKARLEEELGRFAKPTGTEGDYATRFDELGTGVDENATEVEGYVDNIAVEGTLEAELKDVNDALAKMETGKYGLCEKTNQPIPTDRLEAYPAARTLVDA